VAALSSHLSSLDAPQITIGKFSKEMHYFNFYSAFKIENVKIPKEIIFCDKTACLAVTKL